MEGSRMKGRKKEVERTQAILSPSSTLFYDLEIRQVSFCNTSNGCEWFTFYRSIGKFPRKNGNCITFIPQKISY